MQQFCTYGSVRGASGQPASLPRQNSDCRLLKTISEARRAKNQRAEAYRVSTLTRVD